jgi:hypothetical protein
MKQPRFPSKSKQGGFLLPMIMFAVALLLVVVGVVAATNKGGPTNSDPEKARMYAASIVQMGGNLRDAALRYGEDRNINSMTFATTASVGLYDPAIGIAVQSDVPAGATAAGSADVPFTLDKTNIVVTGLGTAAAEMAMTAPSLGSVVCQQINRIVNGDAIDAAIPTSVGARQEGCAFIGGTPSNTYYKVIKAG